MKTQLKFLSAVIFLCLAVFVFTGCATAMNGIAPSTTPITAGESYTRIGETTGYCYGFMLIGIPFFEPMQAEKAKQRAIEKVNADALVEAFEQTYLLNLVYLAFFCTKCEGTGIKLVSPEAERAPQL
jgi:hypothetical protein